MASHTISDRFPESAAISAFLASSVVSGEGVPPGAAAATGTVSSGDVTLTGLSEGQRYIAFNDADEDQNVAFTVDSVSTALASDFDGELTGDIEMSGAVDLTGTVDLPANTVVKADVADDAIGQAEVDITIEDVTVLAGQTSGTATVVTGTIVLGIFPVSNQDQTIDSVLVSGTTLTVTLAAAATADNVFKVATLEP